jgi:hypothetical protein
MNLFLGSGVTDEFSKLCDQLHNTLYPTVEKNPLERVIQVQTWWQRMGRFMPVSRRLRMFR